MKPVQHCTQLWEGGGEENEDLWRGKKTLKMT
jgi:hypothetical protein